ncbi:MAG: radical SAM protein [Gemmatimonadota bacterium]|nr:radical SAM protein [Gemmatimonadota bacterium]
MNPIQRVARHARLTSYSYRDMDSPPFLVLFINSICNMKCEHCFYWTALNQKNDLSKDEIFALSRSLGQIENLNLSGGEPFLRPEFGEICRQFISHNGVKEIYVPTNGYFTDKTIAAITEVLKEPSLKLFVAEISLDGMPVFHDKFRVAKNAFRKAMETYEALVELQKKDPRVRIHSISTATDVNMDEIKKLTTYLYERCPQMDHHNLAIIRGDRKNPTLVGPSLKVYEDLYEYIRRLWAPREAGRRGSLMEPMLQWAKVETVKQAKQVIPCKAGKISGVVYANGDVGVCEIHKPIGNLRKNTFPEIWHSEEAKKLRESIARKECYCTTEVFMWSSIAYQPLPLAQALLKGKVWSKPLPLHPSERVPVSIELDGPAPRASATSGTADDAAEAEQSTGA